MQVEILDLGCTIVAIDVPNQSGELVHTVLRYNNLTDYQSDSFYLGCTVGRYANRIEKATASIDQTQIKLSANEEGTQHLHGGFKGFNQKIWTVNELTKNSIEFQIESSDGEEGFPGNLTVIAKHILTDDNELQIHYRAYTDKATWVNLTNHSYFNLADDQVSIDTHDISIQATHYAPFNAQNLPIAPYILPVEGTVYDLNNPKSTKIVKEPICNANYFLDNDQQVRIAARIQEKNSGRILTIFTDYPAIQVYFAKYLSAPFVPYQGICLEPQYAPNAPNIVDYKSALLRPGQEYKHALYYRFDNF